MVLWRADIWLSWVVGIVALYLCSSTSSPVVGPFPFLCKQTYLCYIILRFQQYSTYSGLFWTFGGQCRTFQLRENSYPAGFCGNIPWLHKRVFYGSRNPQHETLLDIHRCLLNLCAEPHNSEFCDNGSRQRVKADGWPIIKAHSQYVHDSQCKFSKRDISICLFYAQ